MDDKQETHNCRDCKHFYVDGDSLDVITPWYEPNCNEHINYGQLRSFPFKHTTCPDFSLLPHLAKNKL